MNNKSSYFKILIVLSIVLCTSQSKAQISDNGHPEHFIAGALIGGVTSYFVFKKTDHKFKSWLIGTAAATTVGLIKELIDPSIDRVRSGEDFAYTVLGGAVGACIVIPLKRKDRRAVAYLY